jgi:hypothetical protein
LFTWAGLVVAATGLSEVVAPAIGSCHIAKVLSSAGPALPACLCGPLPVPALGASAAGDRTGGPWRGRTQDTVNWGGGYQIFTFTLLGIGYIFVADIFKHVFGDIYGTFQLSAMRPSAKLSQHQGG